MAQSSALRAVPNTDTTAPDVETLARMIVTRQEQIDELANEVEQLKQELAGLLPEGGPAGPYKVTVTVAKRLDAKAVMEAFPVAQHPMLYTPTVDTKFARPFLEKSGQLDAFLVAGKPSVKVL